MHPGIREILRTSSFCHAAIEAVAALLPEDDEALNAWIGQTVAEHDLDAFNYLMVSAIHLGRKVAARHLEGGMHLIPNPQICGCLLWHLDGEDLPERVLAGLKQGGIHPETRASAYFTVWRWCVERRDGQLPEDFLTSVRKFSALKIDSAKLRSLMIIIAGKLKDGPMLSSLEVKLEQLESVKVAAAAEKLMNSTMELAKGPILDFVPAKPFRPQTGVTVRRSVESFGRNEPCRCGSGRKYKRCCEEGDRRRLSQSSEVAGKTGRELRAAPMEFLTAARLERLQSYEMARINPLEIDEDLVEPFLIRLTRFEMFTEAAAAIETLGWSEGIAEGWKAVICQATNAGRKDIVERLVKVRGEVTPDMTPLYPSTRLLLARDDPGERLRLLEDLVIGALRSGDSDELGHVAYGILLSMPALGILVARGLIPVLPPSEALFLLERILSTRIQLELPEDEPYGEIMDMIQAAKSAAARKKNAEALSRANRKLEAKEGEVRRMKQSIDEMKHEISRREKLAASRVGTVRGPAPANEQPLQELRLKVRFLKESLKERHEERNMLRRDLEKTLTDLEALRERKEREESPPQAAGPIDPEDSLVLPGEVEGYQPVRVIEFPKRFHRTLEEFPKQVAKGAMLLLGRLAAGDPAAFTGVVRLQECPDTLRVRVGIDHRLLFRLSPDCVQVVDLINRRDLESRIKQL